MGERGKGLRSTDWQLQNSHRDVRYSTGGVVTNSVITMCGVRGALDLTRGALYNSYKCLTTMLHTQNRYNVVGQL